MIEKKLHFIWLGDNVPDYYEFAAHAFELENPSFEINRVLYPKGKIESISRLGEDEITNQYDRAMWYAIRHYKSNQEDRVFANKAVKNITEILERFRLYLVSLVGGICIDCDTFPIKPIPDEVLDNDMVGLMHLDNNCSDKGTIGFDTSMFPLEMLYGMKCQQAWSNVYWKAKTKFMFSIYDRHFQDEKLQHEFALLRENFFGLTLTKDDIQNTSFFDMDERMYFMHFCDFSWNYYNEKKCKAQNVCI